MPIIYNYPETLEVVSGNTWYLAMLGPILGSFLAVLGSIYVANKKREKEEWIKREKILRIASASNNSWVLDTKHYFALQTNLDFMRWVKERQEIPPPNFAFLARNNFSTFDRDVSSALTDTRSLKIFARILSDIRELQHGCDYFIEIFSDDFKEIGRGKFPINEMLQKKLGKSVSVENLEEILRIYRKHIVEKLYFSNRLQKIRDMSIYKKVNTKKLKKVDDLTNEAMNRFVEGLGKNGVGEKVIDLFEKNWDLLKKEYAEL